MAITNSFKEAVLNGNVKGIRIMMKDSLLVDPSFTEFNEMYRLSSSVSGLFDPHDGRELRSDTSTWNNEYMDKLMVQVVSNFSNERIKHLKEVVRHLRPIAQRPQSRTESLHSTTPGGTDSFKRPHTQPQRTQPPRTQPSHNSGYQKQKEWDKKNGNFLGTEISKGAIVGAVVGGLIVAIASANVIGGAIIGAVVGGVVGGVAVAFIKNGE